MVPVLVNGIVGVLGILVGIFVARFLQRQGKVRCEPGEVEITVFASDNRGGRVPVYRGLPIDRDSLESMVGQDGLESAKTSPSVEYRMNIKFFNEKDVSTGLRDVAIVFTSPDGARLECTPRDLSTRRTVHSIVEISPVEVINLPSREWVGMDLTGSVSVTEMVGKGYSRVEFQGYYPDRRVLRKPVPVKQSGDL